jgi:hypothetical protein
MNLTTHINPVIRFIKLWITLLPDWQKESWQTFEETSGHVRPEQVNKWANSMKDR